MSELLKSVDSRTQLVGQNRFEILMFRLSGRQRFAINVFKVQEVLTLPQLTILPGAHPNVVGVIHLRGRAIPVYDLARSIHLRPVPINEDATVIVSEYNSSVQAFLVGSVDRIVNLNWDSVLPPPKGAGREHYLTAVTQVEDEIVEIIDVEKVLAEVQPSRSDVSAEITQDYQPELAAGKTVLMVDDSPTAISQAKATLQSLGLVVHTCNNGEEGLKLLQTWAEEESKLHEQLLMVITDAEMPVMDGYRFTTEIRKDNRLKDLYVILHTSMSGSFNDAMAEKVGCNAFLSKFKADELAKVTIERLKNFADAQESKYAKK